MYDCFTRRALPSRQALLLFLEAMYAIIRTGGKQYQVAPGARVRVEKLAGEVGETVELTDVLLVADGDNVTVGQPVVASSRRSAARDTGARRGTVRPSPGSRCRKFPRNRIIKAHEVLLWLIKKQVAVPETVVTVTDSAAA